MPSLSPLGNCQNSCASAAFYRFYMILRCVNASRESKWLSTLPYYTCLEYTQAAAESEIQPGFCQLGSLYHVYMVHRLAAVVAAVVAQEVVVRALPGLHQRVKSCGDFLRSADVCGLYGVCYLSTAKSKKGFLLGQHCGSHGDRLPEAVSLTWGDGSVTSLLSSWGAIGHGRHGEGALKSLLASRSSLSKKVL